MSKNPMTRLIPAGLIGLAIMLALPGCGSKNEPAADQAAADTAAAQAEQMTAREEDLAKREAEMAAKEQEQTRLAEEAARKEKEAAEKAAAAKKLASTKSSSTKSSSSSSTAAAKPAAAAPPKPEPIVVPASTQLTFALASDLTSKTARAGDPFEGRLVSDLMIGERVAVPSGTRVTGTITDVVSGSKAIGAVPVLGLKFDTLMMPSGEQIPIRGELKEQGNRE
jgi:hypothetical protein